MAATDASAFDPRTQLFPNIVDHYARVKPDAIYAEYPVSSESYTHGYRPITFKAFANAINGIAWWLTRKCGPGDGEILAYMGPNDIRYPALVMGALKAGYCMFLTSPRNSTAAHISLFERLQCTKLLSPVPKPPAVTTILEEQTVDILEVPSIDELIINVHLHFEYGKTYPEAAREPFAVLHTSGSTGTPKPIFWTHDTACKHMNMVLLDPPEGFQNIDSWCFNKRVFLVPPPFHAAGLAYLFCIGMPVGMAIICPISGGLPTAAGLVEARKQTHFDVAVTVPSLIQELSQSPGLLDYCSQHLDHIVYCGGDLPQAIGDTVASKIRLVNRYGATEVGLLNPIYSALKGDPKKDWRYIQFNPSTGAEMRHVADGEYELVVVRKPEGNEHQLAFTVYPNQEEYRTKDLFVRHPDPNKRALWRWSSRVDDVIVFLNGEKTNPVSAEQHIVASNRDVTAALMAGAQRFQASLLVEIGTRHMDVTERATMIEQLWPSIEEANMRCPAHARISKTHVLFTRPDQPMLRAGKGTVQRAATLALYAPELDALYADADKLSEWNGESPGPGCVDDPEVISDYIRASLISITRWDPTRLTDTANLFHLGLDSLHALTATRILKRGLSCASFTPNDIYLHPSVSELTQAVLHLQQQQEYSSETIKEARLSERDKLFEELSGHIHPRTVKRHTVILTGSTGNLGSYILDALLNTPTVAHVHCLNRRPDAREVHCGKVQSYGLTLDESRVTFWTADLAQADLGISSDARELLQRTVTLVLHNAWTVNFNLSLASFKPDLMGVVNLINFSAQGQKTPHLFFISSISSTMGHQTEDGLTPEAIFTTATPGPNGYANSKYLAEQLIDQAARDGCVSASCVRVGQIAGAVRSAGLWHKTEWFPRLALSSLHLGALPDTLGAALDRIDWVPIDLLAEALVDLATRNYSLSAAPANVFHAVNSHALNWEEIRPMVVDALSKISGRAVETITIQDWIQRIRQDIEPTGPQPLSDHELQDRLAKNPAAKLLDFFEGVVSQSARENILDTKLTAQVSERLRTVGAVNTEWIQKWVLHDIMQLLPIVSLFASLAVTASATVTLGQSCSGSGYDCTSDFHSIGVCNGRQWVLSAQCGEGCCVWPGGDPAPWCRC
ncbi:hypothetical protein BDV25DRAFT_143558 [Aspergillus avenaceus]|uniref:Carrier domain-containing protein n=1 Tax=Aspergillus avenaceus TaxID=36643 RepID=A0A5N6TJQ1_ASPAV|nr:hypothetical protein BDV25DRAFT_143558 [Aspergillus avenaceus]